MKNKTEKLVVIGNGMAGVATVEEILKKPSRPDITIIGGEPHTNYNRIYLSDVLACAKAPDEIFLNRRPWYEENGIHLETGVFVTGIDPNKKTLTGRDGRLFEYDKLLIATGSNPFIPPIKGSDKKGVFTFRNLDDTEGMIRWASEHYRAVVVGGGLLGLEAARGLTNRGMAVSVVHLMGHLMEQQLDAKAGRMLETEIRKMGIHVRTECTVEEIKGNGSVESVRLTTGELLETDLVLITAGIRPNSGLAAEAGIPVKRGILVDDGMKTETPGIYAVGECVEHRGKTFGLVAPILEQAKAAADSITGDGGRVFTGFVPSAKLKVAGIHLNSMGDFNGKEEGSEELVYMDGGLSVYKKLVIRENRVVGAIFLGDDNGSRQVQEVIQSRQDISSVRSTLLSGTASDEGVETAESLPDSAIICNCHSVTKAEIAGAVCEKLCLTREQVSGTTKAGTGCGGCVSLMEEVIEGVLEQNPELVPGGSPAKTGRKARAGSANKIETLKKEKDGLDVWDDLLRYAKEGWEAIPEDDVQRLKWYGIFLRVPTPGFFMLRVRIPNGIANSEQIRVLGEIAHWHGNGTVDITTRQQVQIRNLKIGDMPKVLDQLRFAGLTSVQTGMDSIRNVVGCPVSGLTPDELHDTAGIIKEFNNLFLNNREFSNLPRKLNVVVTGCRDNCTHSEIQDIALVPALKQADGEEIKGFNVLIGGKLGSGGFRAAEELDVFVRPGDAPEILKQMVLIYRDHGPRGNRTRARLAFLMEEWGRHRFRKELESRMGLELLRAGRDERNPKKKTDHIGIFRQSKPGQSYVGLSVPVGRVKAVQMAEAARLSDTYGNGEIRLTGGQNLIIPNVPDQRLGSLLEEPLLKELRCDPSEVMRGLVSCTGSEYCGLALIETKKRSLELARVLEKKADDAKAVNINWSGCPASCGNHLLGDIGFLGKRIKRKTDGGKSEVVEAVDIYIGGRSGVQARAGTKVYEDVPCEELNDMMPALVRYASRDKGVRSIQGEKVSLEAFANLKPVAGETREVPEASLKPNQ